MTIDDYEILLTVFLAVLFGFLLLLVSQGRRDWKGHKNLPSGSAMKPYLFLFLFYINPEDPRSLLPKSNASFGWTVNFRNKGNALVFASLLLAVLASAIGMTIEAIKLL
jgi:uncharacterized membrane protein